MDFLQMSIYVVVFRDNLSTNREKQLQYIYYNVPAAKCLVTESERGYKETIGILKIGGHSDWLF